MRLVTRIIYLLWMFVAATVSVSCQTVVDVDSAPPSRFEVASVKISDSTAAGPSFSPPWEFTFSVRNVSMLGLVGVAFHVSDAQVKGLPKWSEAMRYDIAAKPEAKKPLGEMQRAQALQELLKDRFHLAVHHETKLVIGYQLIVAKHGAILQPASGDRESRVFLTADGLRAPNTTLAQLASSLEHEVGGTPVADCTGIKGRFNIRLKYAREETEASELPSVGTALQEQLGLKLVRGSISQDIIVVDHVDRNPTPD